MVLSHNSRFLQNRIPIFWLVVHLICIITPQLCKAPCSEQLTATFNPRSVISFNYFNFFFPISQYTLHGSLLSLLELIHFPSSLQTKSKYPNTALGEYSSVNDPNCPQGLQKQMAIEREMISSKLFSYGCSSCLVHL